MVNSSCVLALPTSLVLLLHLHILSYTQCNAPEYSPTTLFASTRPLRDRTKTMEDIVAFLIEKIEGKEKRKSILGGIYPCLQPSDTVGFRVNVAKYIEMLRAAVTRPSNQASTSKGRMPVGPSSQATSLTSKSKFSTSSQSSFTGSSISAPDGTHKPVAWWWSAVVVRKSLLEECSGDRFEKMLLALSTHALFVQVPSSSPLHPLNTSTSDLTNTLQNQPQVYANLLSQSLGLQKERIDSVSRINIRAQELISLRARLSAKLHDDAERVNIKRLIAVRDSKWQDLVDAWETTLYTTQDGQPSMAAANTLKWLLSIAGVSRTQSDEHSSSKRPAQHDTPITISQYDLKPTAIQTLPTASAHHPANTHKLRSLPPFVSLSSELSVHAKNRRTSNIGTSLAPPALQELLTSASSQKAALTSALESAVSEGRNLSLRLDAKLQTIATTQPRDADTEPRSLKLWTPATIGDRSPKIFPAHDPDVLKFLNNMHIIASRSNESDIQICQRIEAKVLAHRESLIPSIPSPATWDADISQESLQQETPLAVAKQQSTSSKVPLSKAAFPSSVKSFHPTPRTPRPYQTSTPPTKSSSKFPRSLKGTVQLEEEAADNDDTLLTPTGPRGSTLLAAVKSASPTASPSRELIVDMSLPDFSVGDMTETGIFSSHESENGREWHNIHGTDEDMDMPFEGHSVTLRDILLRVGDGEDSFHLIDDLDDLDEDVGNETTGWG